ncbi:MAG: YqgE/AlgH family protein [Pseudomonadota bacterium]
MDLSGKILIAMPALSDPRFAQSVILICAHSDDGAMGLVINKPSQGLSFERLLGHLDIAEPGCGARQIRVHIGGPVERGRGFVLHSGDWWAEDGADGEAGAGTLSVPGGYGMTATLDILSAMAKGRGPALALLALGYSGWGPGQLEAEIGRNDWLTADATEDVLFSDDDAGKWTGALRHMGINPLTLSPVSGRA